MSHAICYSYGADNKYRPTHVKMTCLYGRCVTVERPWFESATSRSPNCAYFYCVDAAQY